MDHLVAEFEAPFYQFEIFELFEDEKKFPKCFSHDSFEKVTFFLKFCI